MKAKVVMEMCSPNDLRKQQEAEFEVGVLASMVAGLDERDDNVLNFISNLLGRLDREPGFGEDFHEAAMKALAAIDRVSAGDGDFDEAYRLITEAVDLIYRSMSSTRSASLSLSRESPLAQDTDSGPTTSASDSELLDFISETDEYLASAEMALLILEKAPKTKEQIDEVFRCFHNIKGIAGFFDLGDVQQLAHEAESLMDGVRSGAFHLTPNRAQVLFDAVDALKDMVGSVRDTMAGGTYKSPTLLTGLMAALKNSREASALEETHEKAPVPQGGLSTDEHVHTSKTDDVVRVATPKLDTLIDSVGELVIANGMVQQDAGELTKGDPRFVVNVQRLGKIVREIQEQAMVLRMVSLESTFRKLARVARDISVKSGIPVNFTSEGEDTELDRSMVEEIQSPLVHMIRNAVDHGIEPPMERTRLGKPRAGSVHISASHEGGNVLIRIEDDGRGLDKEKILKQGVKKGLVDSDAALEDENIYDLIFEPGFSTNTEVTEISGRGVGMDVVKKSVDKLRGRIEISVRPGHGTVFSIWLPLTMAIIDGMVITVGAQHFLIPSIAIQESLRPTPDQIHTVRNQGEMILIRGELLPLFRLYELFEIAEAKDEPWNALVLVITDRHRRCALLVDDLLGQQQTVVKPIGSMFAHVHGVSGASIMGDGSVALILDAAGILRMARGVGTY